MYIIPRLPTDSRCRRLSGDKWILRIWSKVCLFCTVFFFSFSFWDAFIRITTTLHKNYSQLSTQVACLQIC